MAFSTLPVPWTARSFSQSFLKEISPDYSLEGLMLELKLQYFGHVMWRTDSWKRPWCWDRLKARGEGDDRGWDGWMASPTWWTWVWVNSGSWWWTGRPGVLQSMESLRVRHDWETELNKQFKTWNYFRLNSLFFQCSCLFFFLSETNMDFIYFFNLILFFKLYIIVLVLPFHL